MTLTDGYIECQVNGNPIFDKNFNHLITCNKAAK